MYNDLSSMTHDAAERNTAKKENKETENKHEYERKQEKKMQDKENRNRKKFLAPLWPRSLTAVKLFNS